MTEQSAVVPHTRPDLGPRFHARGARHTSASLSASEAGHLWRELTKHPRVQDSSDDIDGLVGRSGEHDSLLPKSSGRDFTNDGICRRTDRAIVDEIQEDQQSSRGHFGLLIRVECHGRYDIQDLQQRLTYRL